MNQIYLQCQRGAMIYTFSSLWMKLLTIYPDLTVNREQTKGDLLMSQNKRTDPFLWHFFNLHSVRGLTLKKRDRPCLIKPYRIICRARNVLSHFTVFEKH